MKNHLLIILLLLFLVSCQKEELNEEIPEWLKPRIEELQNSGECFGCTLAKISFNNSIYYNLYCGYWSCMYFNFYDNNGNLVEWNVVDFNNFLENNKNETIIWSCSDK